MAMSMGRQRVPRGQANDAHIRLVTLEERSCEQPSRPWVLHIGDANDFHQILIVAADWIKKRLMTDCVPRALRLMLVKNAPDQYAVAQEVVAWRSFTRARRTAKRTSLAAPRSAMWSSACPMD